MTHDAPPGDAPVNIAPPQWQCPHCLKNFHSDLDAATRCAQAGPPEPAPDGVPVLVLPSRRMREGSSSVATFGLSKAGPVKSETVDGVLRHRRDVRVGQLVVDARDIAAATRADLVVLANQDLVERVDVATRIGPSGYGLLDKLFRFDATGRLRTPEPVWRATHHSDALWWRAPDEQERATLNMLTGDLLDRVARLDLDAFASQVEAGYRGSHHQKGSLELASGTAAVAIAQAHGAPSHIWALRWLSMHVTEVARWQAQAAIAWAAGTGGPIPMARRLWVSTSLPKSPGKKRLALMAPLETEDYAHASNVLADRLSVDPPSMPVPHLGDVVADLRANRKEVHRVR